jgi:hypothetical protein
MINKNFHKFTTQKDLLQRVKSHLSLLICMHIQRKKVFLCMVVKKNKILSLAGNYLFYFGKILVNLYIINAIFQLTKKEKELQDYLFINNLQLTIATL